MGSVYALPSVTASLLKPVEPLRLFSYHGQFFSEFGCASVRLFKKPPRIFVTLLNEMQKRDAKKGLATLCIGGGMGIALTVER